MALSDYNTGIGAWLKAGWHDVIVGTPDVAFSKVKGTPGVKYQLQGDRGKSEVQFWLTPDALPFLASFATACGLTDAQLQAYDEKNPNSHNILIGKRVKVLVEAELGSDGKTYHRVDCTWCNASDPTPLPDPTAPEPMNEPPPAPAPTPAAALPADDGVPF